MTPTFQTMSRRQSGGVPLAIFSAVLCGPMAFADQVALTPVKDTTLYSVTDDTGNGAGEYVFAGNNSTPNIRRALLAFDLSSIPSGSTIQSVTLRLQMSRTRGGPEFVRLHRVLQSWGEGSSNAGGNEGGGTNAANNDATWRYRFYNVSNPGASPAWTSLGGDFVLGQSAVQSVDGNGFYTWSSTAGLVADVQGWLDNPGSNFGWVVIGNEGGIQTAKRFASRTHGTVANRPLLTVNYTLPAATGACCFTNGTCQILTQTNCGIQSGNFQGDGTSCTPNPCPQPTGACCFDDASCQVLTQNACGLQGGTYQGDAVNCDPGLCQIPTGACCFDSGLCQVVSQVDCLAGNGTYQGNAIPCAAELCPVILEPFVDAMPIPAVAQPIMGSPGGIATYEMAMLQFQRQLHRDLPPTTVWGFSDGTNGGTYPGPTIVATSGLPVTVKWINDLRDGMGQLRTDHFLDVDLCLHGAADEAKTVVHLHGGHVPMESDGYPESTFLPGNFVTYEYPNIQPPALIWYHDHALGITRLNVMMGLAGGYLIRDDFEDSLGLPSGEHHLPLIVQDRVFDSDGSFRYPAAWQGHFFGDTLLVNGKVWPYLDVKQGKYRFRLLNGCNSRTLTLSLSNGQSFQQIGTDSGMLAAPVTLTSLTFGPGERADVVIDFAMLAPETEVLLINSAPSDYPGIPGEGVIPNVMKFIVQGQAGHTAPVPIALRPVEPIAETEAVLTRDFELRIMDDPCAGSMWLINELGWDDITEFPVLGTAEVWRFINRTGVSHPMHLHMAMFQVLDRQDFEVIDGEVVLSGDPILRPPNEAGWKDTVLCPPQQVTRVLARFDDFTGLFPYHCHMLEHEDHEMMRQFQVQACKDNAECLDADLCNGEESCDTGTGSCQAGAPVYVPYGDVYRYPTGLGVVDVDDILYVLNGFSDFVSYPEADLHPCERDGDVDVDDILAILDAFAGITACPDTCPPPERGFELGGLTGRNERVGRGSTK